MYCKDHQIVAGGVEIANASLQFAACTKVELSRRFEFEPARGLDDEQFAAQFTRLVFHSPQQFLADSLTLELLTGPDPVQIEGSLRQWTTAVRGETANFLALTRNQKMVPTLFPLCDKFGP